MGGFAKLHYGEQVGILIQHGRHSPFKIRAGHNRSAPVPVRDIPLIQQEAAAYDFASYMSCVENLLDGRWPHEQPVGCFFQSDVQIFVFHGIIPPSEYWICRGAKGTKATPYIARRPELPPPPSLPAVLHYPQPLRSGAPSSSRDPHFPLILIIEKRYIFSFFTN